MYCATLHLVGNKKVKTTPLQAWTGTEGSRRLRFPHFKTIGTSRK
jgi:hypothetical protein